MKSLSFTHPTTFVFLICNFLGERNVNHYLCFGRTGKGCEGWKQLGLLWGILLDVWPGGLLGEAPRIALAYYLRQILSPSVAHYLLPYQPARIFGALGVLYFAANQPPTGSSKVA